MTIDEAGENNGLRQVDDFCAGRKFRREVGGVADGLDAIAFDPDDLIGGVVAGADVEDFSGANGEFGRRGGRFRLRRTENSESAQPRKLSLIHI